MNLENRIIAYCKEYNVPLAYLFEILEDQKVVPMIRGKATEYNAYLYLKENLDSMVWDVQKLNLNAQNNLYDEDISITHRRTGIRLKVESKNACRGSMNIGKRTKVCHEPHFKVKCHRSRSNIQKADTTNDRYMVGEFDLLVCNPSNALYEGRTVEEKLQIINDNELIKKLYEHYSVSNEEDLIDKCNNDWRFVIPEDIAESDNSIPRTPYVLLSNDSKWFDVNDLNERLLNVVKEKVNELKVRTKKK